MSEIQLRQLGRARPPPALRSAMLEGALRRVHAPSPTGVWRLALASAAVVLAAVLVAPLLRAPAGPTRHVTQGEARTVALGPHAITLAPHSQALVGADAARADVEIASGQASFDVAKLRAEETFRVRTAQVTVDVVGTSFDVEADGACSRVAVREGKVRVTPAGEAPLLLVPPQERTFCGGLAAQVPSEAEALIAEALPLVASQPERAGELLGRALDLHPGGVVETEALFHLWVVQSSTGRAGARGSAGDFLAREPEGQRAEKVRRWLEGR